MDIHEKYKIVETENTLSIQPYNYYKKGAIWEGLGLLVSVAASIYFGMFKHEVGTVISCSISFVLLISLLKELLLKIPLKYTFDANKNAIFQSNLIQKNKKIMPLNKMVIGIDLAIWQEVNTLWPKRMQEDSTFTIVNLYGEAFMKANNNPKILALNGVSNNLNEGKSENLERLKNDKDFYLELDAARSVAYEYGIDGAQWIMDEFGISLTDFQAVAMEWVTKRNMNYNTEEMRRDADFQEEIRAEYKERFATEQGGNIADDVEF